MHDFEVFRRSATGSRAQPMITIQRRGTFSLNAAAHRALGSPRAVELLFNAERRIVALRSVDPRAEQSHLIRPASRSGGGPYLISATSFTRYYEIDTSVALRRNGYLSDDMLCIDLDGPAESVSQEVGPADTAAPTGIADVHAAHPEAPDADALRVARRPG